MNQIILNKLFKQIKIFVRRVKHLNIWNKSKIKIRNNKSY
jgi:hypothetical protein